MEDRVMREKGMAAKVIFGLAAGTVVAACVSWFAGVVYREGSLLTPLVALSFAAIVPFLLYEEPAKQVTFSLLNAALLASFSLLTFGLGGQAIGPTVFGLCLVAIAVPVGTDLILQDLGTRLTVPVRFSHGAASAFVAAVLPLSMWLVSYEHHTAVEEDNALMWTVEQNMSPQGDTLVFDQVDPRQKEKLKKLVSVRTPEKTYSLSDAEVESVVEERTVRRESRTQPQSEVVSREQAERMRLILKLQGASVPEDITLVSHRGPITVSELKVPLEKKDPG